MKLKPYVRYEPTPYDLGDHRLPRDRTRGLAAGAAGPCMVRDEP